MSGVEQFRQTIIDTCRPEMLNQYRQTQRTIQKAVGAFIEPSPFGQADSTSGLGLALTQLQEVPTAIQDKLNLDDPITKAAMLIGAVSLRAWIYKKGIDGQEKINYEEVWHQTKLRSLAARCDEIVGEIIPETHRGFIKVDIDKMREDFRNKINSGMPEHIVVTGLNAVGKSKIITAFEAFLKTCDVTTKVIKMPRPDGPLSTVIQSCLRGELKLNKNALQMVFLADALDLDPEPDTLFVFDRNSIAADSFVYGSPEIADTVLSTRGIEPEIYQTFILDQHPMACAQKVSERERAPRIFEDHVEKMVEQLIRFARLTVLPGIHWINNDIPRQKDRVGKGVVPTAIERFIGSVFFSGTLQRFLLKSRKFTNYNDASNFIYLKWLDFEEKQLGNFLK